jgi:hypothetical protein
MCISFVQHNHRYNSSYLHTPYKLNVMLCPSECGTYEQWGEAIHSNNAVNMICRVLLYTWKRIMFGCLSCSIVMSVHFIVLIWIVRDHSVTFILMGFVAVCVWHVHMNYLSNEMEILEYWLSVYMLWVIKWREIQHCRDSSKAQYKTRRNNDWRLFLANNDLHWCSTDLCQINQMYIAHYRKDGNVCFVFFLSTWYSFCIFGLWGVKTYILSVCCFLCKFTLWFILLS